MLKNMCIFVILLLLAVFLWICCVFYVDNEAGGFCLGLVATGVTAWVCFLGEELIEKK